MTWRILCSDGLAARGQENLRSIPGVELEVHDSLRLEELRNRIAGAHALIVRSATKVTAELLGAAKELRVVGRAGIGVDNIDVEAASRRGVVVMNTPRGNAITTAEHAIALLLALARHIPQATASVKSGKWERSRFAGSELCSKTLGILGLGNIGRLVAERALGLQMRVVGFDPFVTVDAAQRFGVERVSFEDLLARSDFITIHTPLTDETRGLLGRAALAKCKSGVLVVNAARGGIVDEEALYEAIVSEKVGGAALDVYSTEPPKGNKLFTLDRVICTPHLGASTEEAQERVSIEIAEQVAAFLTRGEVAHAINLPALPPELRERLTPWLELATRLGSLAGQLSADPFDEVTIEATGDAAEGVRALASSALAGLLRGFLDFPVNWVNAPIVAAERGIRVSEVTRRQEINFKSAIGVRLVGPSGQRSVAGTVLHLGDQPEARIVDIDGYHLEAMPEGCLLVLHNEDRPGVIGAVGTLLGRHNINVSRMQVALGHKQREALQLWNVDSPVSSSILADLRQVSGVRSVTQVKL